MTRSRPRSRSSLRPCPGRGLADLVRVLTATRLLGGARALGSAIRRDGATLSAVVRAGARRFGDRPALIDSTGHVGYRELDRLVDAAARGIPAGARVAVVGADPRWLLVTIAAVVRAGADAVLIGPGTGRLEFAGIHEREQITHTLTESVPLVVPPEVSRSAPADPARGADRLTSTQASEGVAARRPSRGRIVLLSSGTTGAPTGTVRSAVRPAQLLTVASLLAAVDLRPGDPVLILPPLHHGHGLSLAIACLLVGAPIVARGPNVVDLLDRHRVAVLSAVPTQLHRLADELDDDHRPLTSLRRVVCGSARLPAPLAQRLAARLGPVLVDLYGTTQTGTLSRANAEDAGTVGRPVAGVRLRVVDERACSVPRGTVGRVRARSPFGTAELATGDLGFVDAHGRLVLAGRDDGLTVSGGENISAAEVEDYLATQPEVADVAVSVVADVEFDRVLVAMVVLRAPVTADELRARVARDLARHKAPRRIEIVPGIDRTETGKARSR